MFQREKLQRQLNYARSINERNRHEYETSVVKPRSRQREEEAFDDDMMDRRKLVSQSCTIA